MPLINNFNRKKNKYRNVKVEVDGIKFHSIKESNRYIELQLMQRAGVISGLELQPRFDIIVEGIFICFYKADFRYFDNEKNGAVRVEDVKGMRTPVYRLKKKLVEALYGIEIIEI